MLANLWNIPKVFQKYSKTKIRSGELIISNYLLGSKTNFWNSSKTFSRYSKSIPKVVPSSVGISDLVIIFEIDPGVLEYFWNIPKVFQKLFQEFQDQAESGIKCNCLEYLESSGHMCNHVQTIRLVCAMSARL